MGPTVRFADDAGNKNTMNAADIMYGVTMQERGVSQIVSVKFNEYKAQPISMTSLTESSIALPAAV
jgi:hypothetical protein